MNFANSLIKEKELSDVETKHHTPEGLFTGSTKDIVDGLLKDANGDEELALKRINYYINRAGDGLSNKTAVHNAKKELEKKVEEKKESIKNSKFIETVQNLFSEIQLPNNTHLDRIVQTSGIHPDEPSTVTYNKSTEAMMHSAHAKAVEDYAQDKYGIPPFCWDPKFYFYQKRFGLNNPIKLIGIYNPLGLGRSAERKDVLLVNNALSTDDNKDSFAKDDMLKLDQNRKYSFNITVDEFKDCFNKDENDPYAQKNAQELSKWLTNIKNAKKSRYKDLIDPNRVADERNAKNMAFEVFKNHYAQLWQGCDLDKALKIITYMSTHDPEMWDRILSDYLKDMPDGRAAQSIYAKQSVNNLEQSIQDHQEVNKSKKQTVAADHVIDFDGEE